MDAVDQAGPFRAGRREVLDALVAVLDDAQPLRVDRADGAETLRLDRQQGLRVGRAHRLVEQVEGGDRLAALVTPGDSLPQLHRALHVGGLGPKLVAVALAGVVGGALAAGGAVQVQNAVDAGVL